MKLTAPAQPAEPGPRLSVLAVVTRATSRGSEVLLVRRANPPQPGHWGFPGGKVDWGEGLCQAAIRELKERSEEQPSELQSLMRISYAVFCLKKKKLT